MKYIENEDSDTYCSNIADYLFSCYITEIRMNDIYMEVVPPIAILKGYYHPWIIYLLQTRDFLL